jgi:2-keto-4-pentenoate hydratase/2-oxohepta-3-ene-1,7-dioic acid hydratase in catechol pathway
MHPSAVRRVGPRAQENGAALGPARVGSGGMQFLRLHHGGADYYGRRIDEATVRLWTAAPWSGGVETDRLVPLRTLLAPVQPSKVVCVGRNYREHAKELGNEVPKEPLLFLKPPTTIVGPGAAVELPRESERVEHEGELALVIGRTIRRATEAEAASAIFGVTCADDVTARDLQKKDVQFTRGKGFDGFCPVGPWIETEPGDLAALALRVEVNGVTRQSASTGEMVFSPAFVVAYVSQVMTLLPGDLILTGTPAGVAPLAAGDVVRVTIDGIGTLEHTMR